MVFCCFLTFEWFGVLGMRPSLLLASESSVASAVTLFILGGRLAERDLRESDRLLAPGDQRRGHP
jgi:hypothetical protein